MEFPNPTKQILITYLSSPKSGSAFNFLCFEFQSRYFRQYVLFQSKICNSKTKTFVLRLTFEMLWRLTVNLELIRFNRKRYREKKWRQKLKFCIKHKFANALISLHLFNGKKLFENYPEFFVFADFMHKATHW